MVQTEEDLETPINFKSLGAYKKWLAYGHIHKVFSGKKPVKIRGKTHKVKHAKKKKKL